MKKARIEAILKKIELGARANKTSRKHGISDPTYDTKTDLSVSSQQSLLLPTISRRERKAQFNVSQPGHAAPDDGIAWRWIRGTSQVASESSELDQT
ncbi:MAG: hypothetical protein JWR68_347, partial [Polaromonas sp.]|nr:hypothetical protein [Polaromonas sp.]